MYSVHNCCINNRDLSSSCVGTHTGPHINSSCFVSATTHLLHSRSIPCTSNPFGMMSCQFFQLLFVLLKFQFKACFGILQSSNLITCRSHILFLIICSSFASSVLFLTSTLLTLSCHFIPNNSRKIHTVLHQAVVIIFPLSLQTIIIAQTRSNRG